MCAILETSRAGTIAAIDKGGDEGRDYILAGENWTYKKLWTEMAKRFGKSGPLMRMGPLVRWSAGFWGDVIGRLVGEGDINSAAIKMTTVYNYHDSSRAQAELGYRIRDPGESLDDLHQWILEHHWD